MLAREVKTLTTNSVKYKKKMPPFPSKQKMSKIWNSKHSPIKTTSFNRLYIIIIKNQCCLRFKTKHTRKQKPIATFSSPQPMADVMFASFLVLVFFFFSIPPSLQHVSESEPLVRFKKSVNITKGDLNSWVIGSDPCGGKWLGIYCQKGMTVSGIHVTNLGLSGAINVDDLKDLPNLKTVRLDNNHLSGPLPDFFKLRGLKSLMLSNNSLSGEIPADFFKDMKTLKRLFLDNNQFVGNIPSSVMQLADLEEVYLQNNQFSGEIPPGTEINKNLKILNLSKNKLEGNVPESLSDRKSLILKLEGNDLLCGKAVGIECETTIIPEKEEENTLPPFTESNQSDRVTIHTIMVLISLLLMFL